jgi:hypothetical protein
MRKKILVWEREFCTPKRKVSFTVIDQDKENVQQRLKELTDLETEHVTQVVYIT